MARMWNWLATTGWVCMVALGGCEIMQMQQKPTVLAPAPLSSPVAAGSDRAPGMADRYPVRLVNQETTPVSGDHSSTDRRPADPRRREGISPPRGELQPGVGEIFLPPPAIPDVPPSMDALESAESRTAEITALDLESLERLACQNNPTLIQARAQLQGTLGKAVQAGLWPNPMFMYVQDQIGVEGTPGEFVGGVIRQEIPTAHKLQLSRAKYLARTQISEWIANAQEWQVLNDVRIYYFRTLGRQELVEVQKELLKSQEDSLVTTRELYNLGRATRSDVHLANVALQQQRLVVLRTENMLRRSWQDLTTVVGIDLPFRPVAGTLNTDVEPVDWQIALDRLMSGAPQLQQARTKMQGDQLQLERELVEPVPNIFVQAGAGHDFETSEAVGQLQIQMEVPLWDKNQGTIRQARADLARQHAEIRRLELLLRQELGSVYEHYLTALQHVENYEAVILPEARRAYEVRLDSYEDDRIQWRDVLLAQSNYFGLRGQYIEHLITLRENEVLILGFLLHGGLAAPERPTPMEHIDVSPRPR